MNAERGFGFINKYNKDYYGGGLMAILGLAAIVEGVSYKVGTPSDMGPGFFPVALGAVLTLTGILIAATAKSAMLAGAEKHRKAEWRGWICICLSLVAFVIFGRYGGLVPATFSIVFISAMGDRQNTFKSAFILSLTMVVVSVIVFSWALQMQFPLFQWR